MRKCRQKYYDFFSKYYDKFIDLHSSEKQGKIKSFLADQADLSEGHVVLDICAGTGSLLPYLRSKAGMVIGLDFSMGMLTQAKKKIDEGVYLIQGDVSHLPFKDGLFDAITCTHAFYELKGDTQKRCLSEIRRALKKGKLFLLMEHDVPKSRVIRLLFYVRLLSMGWRKAVEILKHEEETLSESFQSVKKLKTGSEKSKVLICRR